MTEPQRTVCREADDYFISSHDDSCELVIVTKYELLLDFSSDGRAHPEFDCFQ
jgi:hypothetical protein